MKRILLFFCTFTALFIFSCSTVEKTTATTTQKDVGKDTSMGKDTSIGKDISVDDLNGKEFMLDNVYKDMKITIGFQKDRVYGFSGVNRYMAGYKLNGSNISLTASASTMMAGPERSMKAEDAYLKLLNGANTIALNNNILTMKTKSGAQLIYKRIK